MNLINKIIEPKGLLIVWEKQEPYSEDGAGKRYVIGEVVRQNDGFSLNYFHDSANFKEALHAGFTGYSIFNINQETHNSPKIMDTLVHRLPSRARTDFNEFLQYYRIEHKAAEQMTDFALLGYTGGKLSGDGFSFIHTFKEAIPPFEMTTEVAGLRHYCRSRKDLAYIKGKNIRFKREPENKHDENAMAITMGDRKIGYINRPQSKTFKEWIYQAFDVEGIVERVNGTETRPLGLLYVRVRNENRAKDETNVQYTDKPSRNS